MAKTTAIDAYIRNYPDDVQKVLKKVRLTIKKVIPKAEESISYGIPTFKMNGKYVVYFSGWKNHISIYPILNEIKGIEKYKSGRGTIKFPLGKPIPYGLITKVTKALLKVNQARTKGKALGG